jgi:hypothetical protein
VIVPCIARFFALALLAMTSLVVACPTAVNEDGRCTSDGDCGDFSFCDPAGVCRCNSDDACDASEFCNLAGSCQEKLECFSDDDCRGPDGDPAAICDTRLEIAEGDVGSIDDGVRSSTAGNCVTLNASSLQCLMDSHCQFGFYCQQLGGGGAICQPGCRDNGDCLLGQPCIDNQCSTSPGACNEPGYCGFGELCDPEGLRCAEHAEADILCQPCDPRFGGNNPCPGTCLIDTSVPINQECDSDAECGANNLCIPAQCTTDEECPQGATCEGAFGPFPGECSQGTCAGFFCGSSSCNDTDDPCPRGYDCNVLIAVSGTACTPGSGTAECGGESVCLGGGENEEQGFCSCTSNADCPPGGECTDPGPNGVCVIGATCAPADGLLCQDVLP